MKDKRCMRSAYLNIQKPMTFVLKYKHCCVLDRPLHRRLVFTGAISFLSLNSWAVHCVLAYTCAHTERALQNPQGITRIWGTLRDSLHYNYAATVIDSKVAKLMERTEVFVLRRKCIQTRQKCVRCISKIFFETYLPPPPTKCWAVYIRVDSVLLSHDSRAKSRAACPKGRRNPIAQCMRRLCEFWTLPCWRRAPGGGDMGEEQRGVWGFQADTYSWLY